MMNEEEEGLQSFKDTSAIKTLWAYTVGIRRRFALSASLIGLSAISHVISARLLGEIIQIGISDSNQQAVLRLGAGIIGLEAAAICVNFWGRKVLAESSLKTLLNIRKALFAHLQVLPMSFIDKQPKGRIVTRLSHDVESMESFFSETLVRLLGALVSMFFVLVGMLFMDPKLGLLVLALMIPAIVLTLGIRGTVRHWNREFAKRNSSINARLSEFLNGLPMIRSHGLEDWSQNQLDSRIDDHLLAAMAINRLNGWSRPLIMFFTQLPMAALLGLGALWVTRGVVSLSHFVSFLRLAERFTNPMNVISQELHVVQTALAHTERVASFLAQKNEEATLPQGNTTIDSRLKGKIEFRNLSMAYESGRPALEKVSFTLNPGEKIGLVGRTGSGKTTTVSLLTRLYEFQDGEILLDDVPIREFNRQWLRGQFSVVTQDSILFYGTLRENLLAGGSAIPDTELLAACRESGFMDVWSKSGITLDTMILDNGENLSAGERQMLSITRSIVVNPSILILDEATANVDQENERLVHNAVNRLMKKRTCLIIAHRLDTLRSCDRILVFKDGQLLENGTESELLQSRGYYYELLKNSGVDESTHEELSNK